MESVIVDAKALHSMVVALCGNAHNDAKVKISVNGIKVVLECPMRDIECTIQAVDEKE